MRSGIMGWIAARRLLVASLLLVGPMLFACGRGNGLLIDGLQYRLDTLRGEAWVVGVDSTRVLGDLSIPATITHGERSYSVTRIDTSAFFGYLGLTSVTIPEGVREIGRDAFMWCENLGSVEIPGSVATVGAGSFANCVGLSRLRIGEGVMLLDTGSFTGCSSLSRVDVPSSVRAIGPMSFMTCGALSEVILREGLETISARAFQFCVSIEGVSIPATVREIGARAFSGCSRLRAFWVDEGNSHYKSEEGVLFSRDGATLAVYPSGRLHPEYRIGEGVRTIAEGAFQFCILRTITIPPWVGTIGEGAFGYCVMMERIEVSYGNSGYRSVDGVLYSSDGRVLHSYPAARGQEYAVLGGVRRIGVEAFTSSANLRRLEFPLGLEEIGDAAFVLASGLRELTIPEGVTRLGGGVFGSCDELSRVTLPSTLVEVGNGLFADSPNLRRISIGAPVPPRVVSGWFGERGFTLAAAEGASLSVPAGSEAAYRKAPGWGEMQGY